MVRSWREGWLSKSECVKNMLNRNFHRNCQFVCGVCQTNPILPQRRPPWQINIQTHRNDEAYVYPDESGCLEVRNYVYHLLLDEYQPRIWLFAGAGRHLHERSVQKVFDRAYKKANINKRVSIRLDLVKEVGHGYIC